VTNGPDGLYRVCVKLYASEDSRIEDDAATFVPIFHEWIREGALDLVLLDVADYAHAPDSPGIMLVAHEVSFALDSADGRFGLLAQRRVPVEGDGSHAIGTTLRHAMRVAALLRVESNDRLRVPNTAAGFRALEGAARTAVELVYGDRSMQVTRVDNDPRDRLALEVKVEAARDVHKHLAA
jgi:hypothetical protein